MFLAAANQTISNIVLAASGGMLLVFALLSVVLNFHWKRYGIGAAGIRRLRLLYFGVAGVLIAVMLVAAVLYIL
jgi:hypothetical protein